MTLNIKRFCRTFRNPRNAGEPCSGAGRRVREEALEGRGRRDRLRLAPPQTPHGIAAATIRSELMRPRTHGAAFSFSLHTTRAPVGATLPSQHHSAGCGRLAERSFNRPARHTPIWRASARSRSCRAMPRSLTDRRTIGRSQLLG